VPNEARISRGFFLKRFHRYFSDGIITNCTHIQWITDFSSFSLATVPTLASFGGNGLLRRFRTLVWKEEGVDFISRDRLTTWARFEVIWEAEAAAQGYLRLTVRLRETWESSVGSRSSSCGR
jgi:hypothetical protein